MGCVKNNLFMLLLLLVVVVFVIGGKKAEAQVHHVVGNDRGWELASDIASWAAGRSFVVGDFLWFAYSSGLEEDKIVELKSKNEFESCDLSKPIKVYDNGLDKISLEEEGIRYFASTNPESCKKGLKLPVEIKSKSTDVIQSSTSSWNSVLAQEPTAPSSSTKICGPTFIIIATIIFYYMGI
ncbi:uclacyanin 1-like [Chenopodium quinoa]|uniref:uclacyanin 1-like n=1 Tax=Chenopodium quinoa TaxID=63459 RepID=UPI000B787BB0|nr:uclacyanin 1-like [Chenopodium quinoa]